MDDFSCNCAVISPHVPEPGKIGLFGGHREDDESFLDCVVREVHEEISLYLPPERFEAIGRYFGPDASCPVARVMAKFCCTLRTRRQADSYGRQPENRCRGRTRANQRLVGTFRKVRAGTFSETGPQAI
jgi:8-oxo-dGTP pyrophosphatase MutT (NUDIX family)